MNRDNGKSPEVRSAIPENRSAGGDNLTLIQFLYVEFFGAFLPGVAAVGAVWAIMSHAAKSYQLVDGSFMKSVVKLGLRPCGFALLLFLAYSVGSIVYRRPHDEPDAASCFRIGCRSRRRHTSCDNAAFSCDDERSGTAPALLLRPGLIRFLNEWMWKRRTGRSKDGPLPAEPGDSADQSGKSPSPGGMELNGKSSARRRGWHKMVPAIFGSIFRCVLEHFDFFFRPERAWYWKRESSMIPSQDPATCRMDCSYPYPFYRRYLYKRGAGHLAKYVAWCTGSPEAARRDPKGKLFINALKQRIREFASPELVRDMVRNEAHVRTLSSLWYILRFLVRFIIWTNILFAVVGKRPEGKHFAITALLLWLVWYLKYIIETGFHYVRLRELNMVLETADILQSKLSFLGKKAPFSDYIEKGRGVCPECNPKDDDEGMAFCKKCRFHPENGEARNERTGHSDETSADQLDERNVPTDNTHPQQTPTT